MQSGIPVARIELMDELQVGRWASCRRVRGAVLFCFGWPWAGDALSGGVLGQQL